MVICVSVASWIFNYCLAGISPRGGLEWTISVLNHEITVCLPILYTAQISKITLPYSHVYSATFQSHNLKNGWQSYFLWGNNFCAIFCPVFSIFTISAFGSPSTLCVRFEWAQSSIVYILYGAPSLTPYAKQQRRNIWYSNSSILALKYSYSF